MSEGDLEEYERNLHEKKLFSRHSLLVNSCSENTHDKPNNQYLITNNDYVAFFIPRLNFFLGKYLRYGGVYPDGVIRLFKKGKAHLPCKNVHEIMEVEGRVGWLQNPLKHIDSPTFKRYLERNSRYIDLLALELVQHEACSAQRPIQKRYTFYVTRIALFFDWMLIKPFSWFLMTTFRHKGILDGWQGVVFSFFSAFRSCRLLFRNP